MMPPICIHHWVRVRVVEHAEIDEADPVMHTAFVLLGCERCRTVDAFPASNAAMCTTRFVDSLRRELAADGWRLPADMQWGPR